MPNPDTPTQPSRNLELKVRVTREAIDAIRDQLAAQAIPLTTMHQTDRYFTVPAGRLKLRSIAYDTEPSRAELIAYRRANEAGSRWSAYRIVALEPAVAEDLATTLAHVLPVLVEVRKRREVAIWGKTRIHLDGVEQLGWFVELETVIDGQGDAAAEAEHREVIARLGLDAWPVEAASYSDILLDSRPA